MRPSTWAAAALFLVVTACTSVAPGIAIQLSANSLIVIRGDSAEVTVTLVRQGGFAEPVSLSLLGLPANVTNSYGPDTLVGATSTSTLTISAGMGAALNTSSLTVVASGGGLTAPAALNIEVREFIVNGRVVTVFDQPRTGLLVMSQGQVTVTGADGSFTLSGLTRPYDLAVVDQTEEWVHIFESLTSAELWLDPLAGEVGALFPPLLAAVGGTVLGGAAIPAGERVVICGEGLDFAVIGCHHGFAGETTYNLPIAWYAGEGTVRAHALHFAVDADDLPTAYLGYQSFEIEVSNGAGISHDLELEPVAGSIAAGVEIAAGGGAELSELALLIRFAPNLAMPLFDVGSGSGDSFQFALPLIEGTSLEVVATTSTGTGATYFWRTGLGGGTNVLVVPGPALPTAPANGAVNVTDATVFSAGAGSGPTRIFQWQPSTVGPYVALSTAATSVTLPDLTPYGLAWVPGSSYEWIAVGSLAPDVDSLSALGFGRVITVEFGAGGSGGPGARGNGSLGVHSSRSFTLAP